MLRRLRPRITYANAIPTLCLFMLLGGGAYAATGFIGSNGQIHACVGQDGQLAVRKAGGHCKSGQSQLAWSQRGPRGIQGIRGSKGVQGTQGEPRLVAMSFDKQFFVDGFAHEVTEVNGVTVLVKCDPDPGGDAELLLDRTDTNHSLFAFGTKGQGSALTRLDETGGVHGAEYVTVGTSTTELDAIAGATASNEPVKWNRFDLSAIRGNACNFHGLVVPGNPSL